MADEKSRRKMRNCVNKVIKKKVVVFQKVADIQLQNNVFGIVKPLSNVVKIMTKLSIV